MRFRVIFFDNHIRLGKLEVIKFSYNLQGPIKPLKRIDRITLHNAYNHTDLSDLLKPHQDKHSFSGNIYHFTIEASGNIYLTHPLFLEGTHVRGRNKNNIGILFLDIDKCADSAGVMDAYSQLVKELENISQKELSVHSHTYEQFVYFNQLVKKHNKNCKNLFPNTYFNESICNPNKFYDKKTLLEYVSEVYVQKHPEDSDKDSFKEILKSINELKLCPGNRYFDIIRKQKLKSILK